MNRRLAAAMTLGAMLAAGSVMAGKVNIPKEGSFEFNLLRDGPRRGFLRGDKYAVVTIRPERPVTSQPAGKPFDRTGAQSASVLLPM